MAKRNLISLDGYAATDVIAVVGCSTGYVGESSSEVIPFGAGDNIDTVTREMSLEHAQSMGRDGAYVCPECEYESQDEYCEDCECDTQWEESEAVEGHAVKLQLGRRGSIHESNESIYKLLVGFGAVGPLINNIIPEFVNLERLQTVIDYDEQEWLQFLDDIKQEEERRLRDAERAKPKVFGARSYLSDKFGWTLESIEQALAVSKQAECGMDEALAGGDQVASECVIRDLVDYIYELQSRLHIRKEGHNA